MSRFALIGYPVAGSLSPALFAAAYGGRWGYDLVETPSFDEAWKRFLAGYDGINVTAPFKLDAFARCDELSDAARQTGAVNLVLRQEGRTLGFNTDVDGVAGALQECPALAGPGAASALVVGTGGAARAAVVAALRLGLSVTVCGRSAAKVQAFSEAFGCRGLLLPALSDPAFHCPEIVIYTLPGSVMPCLSGHPFQEAIVLEAEYRQPALAGSPCRAYIGGRRWLLWQAVAGYRLFTGEEPDGAAMEKAIV
jgi:shikimate dehydrogenase